MDPKDIPQQPVPGQAANAQEAQPLPPVSAPENSSFADQNGTVKDPTVPADVPSKYSLDTTPAYNYPDDGASLAWDTDAESHTEKSATWYGAFGMAVVLAAIVIFLLTRDIATVVVVVVVSLLLVVGLTRKPRTVNYTVDSKGFTIGSKKYPYTAFRSFSVVYEKNANTLILTPLKRFMLPIVLNYPSKLEEQLVELIATRLPFTDKPGDAIDRATHEVRS